MPSFELRGMPRRWLLTAGIVLLLLSSILWLVRSASLPELPFFDFVEYWAAGRLNAQGMNPYDFDRLAALEKEAGRDTDAVPMLNPPWALPWMMPFGLLSAPSAHWLWLLLHFAILVICADKLWRLYGGSEDQRWLGWLVTFSFAPALFALTAGQITPLALVGAVAFLCWDRTGRGFLAGAATVLLAIKPHMVYLFWPLLLLDIWQRKRWLLGVGAVGISLIATGIALFCNPHVLEQYFFMLLHQPPTKYLSPTLGTILRKLIAPDQFRLQFVPMTLGLVWAIFYWRKYCQQWEWSERLPAVLLASMLTAPYGAWPFDLVILLVSVLQGAVIIWRGESKARLIQAALFYLIINGLTLVLILCGVEFFWFIWMTPVLTLFYLGLKYQPQGRLEIVLPYTKASSFHE